jgi:hypothetical protein
MAAPKGYHRMLRNRMLAKLSDEEFEEIMSQPRPGETVEQWLRREDEAMLARYTNRALTKPRPANGRGQDESFKAVMERALVLPTPMKMRLAIAMDLLEDYPPSEAELAEYRAKYPEWPKNIIIEFKG